MSNRNNNNNKEKPGDLTFTSRILVAALPCRNGRLPVPIDNKFVNFTPALAAGFFELCYAKKRWNSGFTDFHFYRARRDGATADLVTALVNRLCDAIDEVHGAGYGRSLIRN